MLIQLTKACEMMCPHCLNSCVPDDKHMSVKDAKQAMDLAAFLKCQMLTVGGGEPTMHPKFAELMEYACSKFKAVTVCTNGTWAVRGLSNYSCANDDTVINLLCAHDNLFFQVTSIPEYYQHSDKVIDAIKNKVMPRLKSLGIRRKVVLDTDKSTIHMHALGRALDNEVYVKEALNDTSCTTSCFRGALVGAQVPLPLAIQALEERGKYCTPAITADGDIGWSECGKCPPFASIHDPLDYIVQRAMEWRPCGKCPDYKKLLTNDKAIYKEARKIMGI